MREEKEGRRGEERGNITGNELIKLPVIWMSDVFGWFDIPVGGTGSSALDCVREHLCAINGR